ncbi:hypothetical protein [Sphingomonas bacterium]|uniref:hypothetical protein n=1 Tax=Sphingomonas bacterium TaxID=1895847 RepID=UPI001576777E|nr:hypothetical protein [Sphingomonas bacterium]
MSLKNLFDGAVSTVTGLAPDAPSSPAALRDPVLRQIDEVEARWSSGEEGMGDGWYHQDGDYVAFTPVLANGATLTIDGQTTTFVPADKFADFLVNLRDQVTAGAFDRQIEAGLHGSANVSGLAQVAMPDRRDGSSEEVRQDQSAELSESQRDGSTGGR